MSAGRLLHACSALTGENGRAVPDLASWLAVVVLVVYVCVALGYGVLVAREELQDRNKPKLQSANVPIRHVCACGVHRVSGGLNIVGCSTARQLGTARMK